MMTRPKSVSVFLILIVIAIALSVIYGVYSHYELSALRQIDPRSANNADKNIVITTEYKGLDFPTAIAFLGKDDLLVAERGGTIERIVNGKLEGQMLKMNVTQGGSNEGGGGLLGLAVTNNDTSGSTYVFVYYTEARENSRSSNINETTHYDPLANRLYRYELVNDKLINPKLLLSLPALPGPVHTGGGLAIGPDGNVYFAIGDLFSSEGTSTQTRAENNEVARRPDGRSGILYVDQNGKTVKGIIGDDHPLNKYYAYGIRNSFGIDFDPVTGKLWDSENGPTYGDEINLVQPGFNSGWGRVMGVWKPESVPTGFEVLGAMTLDPDDLVNFEGRGRYSSPELTWRHVVAPTDMKFFKSDKLGETYRNDLFVGDYVNGNIYHFDLDDNRTSLRLSNGLEDKIVDTPREIQPHIFTHGFGPITAIEEGPDGHLYFAVFLEGHGTIFKITTKDELNPFDRIGDVIIFIVSSIWP
jgi:aldose sugar dehydrogenase